MSRGSFTAIKTEGGLLPREILERVGAEDDDLPGIRQEDYHLPPNERLGEAINRSWNRLVGLWEAYTESLEETREGNAATGLTRDRWLLPLFQELDFGRLQRSTAVEIEGKSFAISHTWQRTPIHLVGAGVSIDRRTAGVAGAAAAAPHSLVQEYLNRSDDHLWAFVSNGRLLRILRDNHSLSRQAYVEFDLEAIMEGELFSDFRILWLVCHQSRVEAEETDSFILEQWYQLSREEGVRALDALRDGVEQAIVAFGAGFLRHPANGKLHEGLRSGTLHRQEYYRELLRLVYRLIFLFVAEDRDVLLDPAANQNARDRYTGYYASGRLRELAGRRRGTTHDDLWRGLRLVLSKLHDGSPDLGLPALGSYLWSEDAVEWIGDTELRNDDLLAALRALCYTTQDHQLLPVNWRTMGSEELGSVYESLLELHPQMNREAGTFELSTAAGHERKTTGSYYTPTSLVDRLLDSALEPVLEEAMRAEDPEEALLELKVCDTAAGSGHFLVAAARRIALRLASVRTGDEEASPEAVTEALRDVVGRCIYGVDLNPLAVELCKVSLWMEALEPGKPLSFLDHHIQVGNSLFGATPALMQEGIPDDAFKEIEGDEKEVVRELRKQNRAERKSEQIGFHTQMVAEAGARYGAIEALLDDLNQADDSTLEAVRRKEARFRRLLDDPRYRTERLAADAWCAAFVWRKAKDAPQAMTEDLFRQIQGQLDGVPASVAMEVRRLADRYRFFHFHVAFPDVFRPSGGEGERRAGWRGGFDAVLGNPPWERTAFEDKQFFALRAPKILEAPTTSARKRAIAALEEDDPPVFEAYQEARRQAEGETHFYKDSGRFPLGASGRINTYALFADLTLDLPDSSGRAGIIVPTGIATDTPMEGFWSSLVADGRLVSIFDFENREKVFPAVHSSYRFSLLTLQSATDDALETVRCAFFLLSADEIDQKAYTLSIGDLAAINPTTRQPPTCRSQRDVELLVRLHQHPKTSEVFNGAVSGWVAFTSSGYSKHYLQREELIGPDDAVYGLETEDGEPVLPLYEGKLIHQFDCRFATYEGVSESDRRSASPRPVELEEREDLAVAAPRFWAPEQVVSEFLQRKGMDREWLIGIRDNARSTDERTSIVAILPRSGMIQPLNGIAVVSARDALWLVGALNSFALDYAARQKVPGTHLNVTIFSQLPIPERSGTPLDDLVERLALELTASTPHLSPFSKEAGFEGRTYPWDADRRFLLRCELDAAFFHVYGLTREDVAFIMDTFPIVRKKDEKEHGDYRTKRLILEIFAEMEGAAKSGGSYRTRLKPAPAHPSLSADADTRMEVGS